MLERCTHGIIRDGRYVLGILVFLIGGFSVACSFDPRAAGCAGQEQLTDPKCAYNVLRRAPLAKRLRGDLKSVLDEPNGLKIRHGFSCAEKGDGATKTTLGSRLEEKAAIPANYDATLFLNGWRLGYNHKDHHVTGFDVILFDIAVDGAKRQLTWKAHGTLADRNGDDSYNWCYHYTMLAWPKGSRSLDIKVVTSTAEKPLIFADAKGSESALHGIVGSHPTAGGGARAAARRLRHVAHGGREKRPSGAAP